MAVLYILTFYFITTSSHGMPQFGGFAQLGEVTRARVFDQQQQQQQQQRPVAKAQTLLVEASVANITEVDLLQFILDNTHRIIDSRSLANDDGYTADTSAGQIMSHTGNFITNRLSAVGNTTSRILNSGMEFVSQSVGAGVALMGSMANVGLNALIDVSAATDQFITRSMDDTVNLIRGAVEEYSGQTQGAGNRPGSLST